MIILLVRPKTIKVTVSIVIINFLIGLLSFCIYKTTLVKAINASKFSDEDREYWAGSNDIFWNVTVSDKIIALSFDDGPHPKYTPQILQILNKNNTKGTFFVVGQQVERFPEVAKMIAESGNEIANHSYSHSYINKKDIDKLQQEIEKAHKTIQEVTNITPALFRPPGGYFNKDIVKLAKENNYKVVLWTCTQDTRDWTNPGVATIVENVLKNAKSGDIILFHDLGGNRTQTVEALEIVIKGLKKMDFEIVTVSELIEKRSLHKVNIQS